MIVVKFWGVGYSKKDVTLGLRVKNGDAIESVVWMDGGRREKSDGVDDGRWAMVLYQPRNRGRVDLARAAKVTVRVREAYDLLAFFVL